MTISQLAFMLFVIAATVARAQENRQSELGSGTIFTSRSELSSNKEIATRMGWDLAAEAAAKTDYALADESFEIYIPPDYKPDKPFGLFVFISPSGSGRPMRQYIPSFDAHHLIYVSPNNVGNDRLVRLRMGLAIDAAANMKARYNIDPDRVYVAGISGGGRVASMLGVGFADVFKGGLYIIGCNFYHQEQSIEQKGFFRRSYNVPPAKVYNLARKSVKHVFLTGDKDGNREQTELYYKGFLRDGFEHATYFQVPDMGHQPPDAEWFEKAMTALDAPLTLPTSRPVAKPATVPLSNAATPATPEATAARLLTTARLYIDNRQYETGRAKLNWIIKNYPNTPASREAAELLQTTPAQ